MWRMLPCLAHRKGQIAPPGAETQDVKDEKPAGESAHLPLEVHPCNSCLASVLCRVFSKSCSEDNLETSFMMFES